MQKIIGLLWLCTLVVGCATTPTPINEAVMAPKSQVFSALPVVSKNPAHLTIVRDSGIQGAEHYFEFWVNNNLLVKLNSGEKFDTLIEPGPVFIEVRMFNVLQSVTPVQVETVFSEGKKYVYRAGIDGNIMLHLHRDITLSK